MDDEGTTYPEKLEVKFGTAPSHSDMTNTIVNLGEIDNITYMKSTTSFSPTETGTYYVGFHGYSDANQYLLLIDDISLTTLTTSIETNIVTEANVVIYPNPTKDILNIKAANNNILTVIDITGKTLFSSKFQDSYVLNTNNFDKGIYIIQIANDNNIVNKRIVFE